MTARAKFATAVGGSALGHLLVLGGAVGWIAIGGVPENDDFSLRRKLGEAAEVSSTGSNFAATREIGEPQHAGEKDQSGSIWWSWRAPQEVVEALVEVELVGADPLVGVYTGFAVGKLEEVAESADGSVSFSPQAGEDYHIAVAGRGRDAEGAVSLRIKAYGEDESEPPDPEMGLLLPEIMIEEKHRQEQEFTYLRTTQNERASTAPDNAAFESDRITIAASELAPEEDGLENLPSQAGEELPLLELATREFAEGKIADDATLAPLQRAEMDAPRPDPVEFPDTFTSAQVVDQVGREQPDDDEAELPEPPREIPASAAPPNPASDKAQQERVFQPQTRRSKVSGTISKVGSPSVDAAETPRGRYHRKVIGAVEKRWHAERQGKAGAGSLTVSFIVSESGKPESLRIIEDDAHPIMTDFTFTAILNADIPPIPEAVRSSLDGTPYKITCDFINIINKNRN